MKSTARNSVDNILKTFCKSEVEVEQIEDISDSSDIDFPFIVIVIRLVEKVRAKRNDNELIISIVSVQVLAQNPVLVSPTQFSVLVQD